VQEAQLRELLVHACHNIPLYRTLYDEVGFRPEQFRFLDDLDKIPLLQKQHLKAVRPEEVVAPPGKSGPIIATALGIRRNAYDGQKG
jgi:phenylacetate-CoA ligase